MVTSPPTRHRACRPTANCPASSLRKPCGVDAAPLSPLGGDLHRVLDDRQTGLWGRDDAKPVQMRLPRLRIGEVRISCLGRPGDHRLRQRTAAHVGQRLGIGHVVGVTGLQQRQERFARIRHAGPEHREAAQIARDLRGSTVTQRAVAKPARSTSWECKPEPQEIPSSQIQPRRGRIQVYNPHTAAKDVCCSRARVRRRPHRSRRSRR